MDFLANESENQSSEQLEFYFKVITLFHPPIIASFSSLNENLQDAVRSGLLNSVLALQCSLKCMSALGLLIRELIEIDNSHGAFNEWL